MYQNFALSVIFFFVVIFLISSASADERYDSCPPGKSSCGFQLKYPFWDGKLPDYCGHPTFKLDCDNNNLTINIDNQAYKILDINYVDKVFTLAKPPLLRGPCPDNKNLLTNTTLDSKLFSLTPNSQNATLFYGCMPPKSNPDPPYGFHCSIKNSYLASSESDIGYLAVASSQSEKELRSNCSFEIFIPVLKTEAVKIANGASNIDQLLQKGFEVKWLIDDGLCNECTKDKGRCGYNRTLKQPVCFCKEGANGPSCNRTHKIEAYAPSGAGPMDSGLQESRPKESSSIVSNKSTIGLVAGILGFVLLSSTVCLFLYRRHQKKNSSANLLTLNKSYSRSSAASSLHILNGSTVFGVHVFNYRELEEATEYFNPLKELGEGGFGTVYYGKLRDGREVAIKRLYENNSKRAEQFLNEVEILANLRHKNLVNLFGCTSRQSRELLLVYEYVPNGTVADHLHGKQSVKGLLSWERRLSIATETASALVYLHDSDIVHRDVKTQNVLLDGNFSVKVADFGLSRLFPLDVTHVSTAPQGTPGYVDPEYHQCYQLTEKSDVYSFGVMLAELISSLPAVDITRRRNEINLSNMAVAKIQNSLHEFVDPSLGFQSDTRAKKEITAVAELAFQCLQGTKEMRPSMNEVLKVLLNIQNQKESELDRAEVVDIPDDDVIMLKGDMSPISPPREDSLVTRYKVNASV
ncbi:LEAF RUST 10 DISEASE-RESISTANCE LOCUS RECEPTOR-LIKE PROTEIN KINASE-like 1.2 [Chenopodium quinoa]|nr:LEAF RUST 10 DISEASE-RESISTANCE LOCUS RECEPTOR-LIKE PROTEIN KINASE-like 1.2 [Chenopodium quinoa]